MARALSSAVDTLSTLATMRTSRVRWPSSSPAASSIISLSERIAASGVRTSWLTLTENSRSRAIERSTWFWTRLNASIRRPASSSRVTARSGAPGAQLARRRVSSTSGPTATPATRREMP
ncbi:Uncharacterised protein [Bordetella pertussis]|nr:Uncharacterised protein [Bordetella pertussis]CFO10274.1 Uncharacterised protein [Bordetella pertussis]CFO36019.1 Uncharacterised protein [Bordetella pertussis]CFP32374.1 Uncharacterised protein [Bordetella pertussis]CFU76954.1 Uncharacterised protein [Bordetella pertussis]